MYIVVRGHLVAPKTKNISEYDNRNQTKEAAREGSCQLSNRSFKNAATLNFFNRPFFSLRKHFSLRATTNSASFIRILGTRYGEYKHIKEWKIKSVPSGQFRIIPSLFGMFAHSLKFGLHKGAGNVEFGISSITSRFRESFQDCLHSMARHWHATILYAHFGGVKTFKIVCQEYNCSTN